MGYFTREILIHRQWRQEVSLSHWFAVSGGVIIRWRGASCLRTWAKIGKNAITLSEFIGYLDLTNFRPISPKHSRNNDKRYLKYLSRDVHLRKTPRIFLATPTLDAYI